MRKNENLTAWIKRLIAEDKIDEFYTSRAWRKVRAESFKRFNYECQECKRNGILTLLAKPNQRVKPGEVIGIGHHKKPLRVYPELALTVENIEPVCWDCHNKIEKKKENKDTELTEEVW